jgi:predicted TPR repeat methyltransferase
VYPEGQRSLDILDAGCGTGLCGPLLRPFARSLVGVDLSEGMLARARRRGEYDELIAAEIVAFIAGRPGAFDVIASADTLVYFGALEPVLAAAVQALRPGGYLVFTLEDLQGEDEGATYRLNPTGRYAHSQGYLRRALEAAGFRPCTIERAGLRREGGDPVAGLLALAPRGD